MSPSRTSLQLRKCLMLAAVAAFGSGLITPALAQDGMTTIFGKTSIEYDADGNVVGAHTEGDPLTCANASAGAAQLNSGRLNAQGNAIAGLQKVFFGSTLNALDQYANLDPHTEFDVEGVAAPLAPRWMANDLPSPNPQRIWADAPAGSNWASGLFDGEAVTPGETWEAVFFNGWYIPSAADAQKMRIRLTYRASDQLVGVYLNHQPGDNIPLLTTPVTRDTSSVGTQPGVAELKGFVQGDNTLMLVVRATAGASQTDKQLALAAAFDGYCFTPSVTVTKAVVPPTDPGKFTLHVNGQATTSSSSIQNGGTTGPVPVEGGTAVKVSEIAASADTRLADYDAQLTCNSANGPVPVTDGSFNMPDVDVSCTLTNTRKVAPTPAPVPTLSEWGLMWMALLAGGLGARRLRRS